MNSYFLPDTEGKILQWGHTNILLDGYISCDNDTLALLNRASNLVRWDGANLRFPQSDLQTAKLLLSRGYSGKQISVLLGEYQDVRKGVTLDLLPRMKLHSNVPITNNNFPEYSFPEVEGLKIRNFRHEDLEVMGNLAIETFRYPKECPKTECDCNPSTAHAHMKILEKLEDSESWNLVWEYNGVPIQFESWKFPNNSNIVGHGYNIHLGRGRPRWFWFESERPVFDQAIEKGYAYTQAVLDTSIPGWKDHIINNYNPKILKETDKNILLQFDLAKTVFKGWPTRKTMGKDWRGRNKDIEVREATNEDIPNLMQITKDAWGDKKRGKYALDNLDTWWNIDKASALMIYNLGKLSQCRLIRSNSDTEAQDLTVFPYGDIDKDIQSFIPIVDDWCRNQGYKSTSFTIEKSIYDSQIDMYTKSRWKLFKIHSRFTIPIAEVKKEL